MIDMVFKVKKNQSKVTIMRMTNMLDEFSYAIGYTTKSFLTYFTYPKISQYFESKGFFSQTGFTYYII